MLYLFSTDKTCVCGSCEVFVSFLVVFHYNDIHLYCAFHPGGSVKMCVISPPTQKSLRGGAQHLLNTEHRPAWRALRDLKILCAAQKILISNTELLKVGVKSTKQSMDHLGKVAKGKRNQTDHQKAFLSTLAFLGASSHTRSNSD